MEKYKNLISSIREQIDQEQEEQQKQFDSLSKIVSNSRVSWESKIEQSNF